MRVQSETQLIEFRDWILRVRPAVAPTPHLLLLVHGWTGDEDSMWVFVRNFPGEFWIVAPRAPYATKPSGYSWRPYREGAHDPPRFEDLRPPAELLLSLVDEYASSVQVNAEQFDMIGFSQGAALANVLALLYPDRVRRVGVLAGFVPLGSEAVLSDHRLMNKPFFVAHGTQDEMVKIEFARQSVNALERAGAQVTFCEDDVGHKLSVNCLHALEKFFA